MDEFQDIILLTSKTWIKFLTDFWNEESFSFEVETIFSFVIFSFYSVINSINLINSDEFESNDHERVVLPEFQQILIFTFVKIMKFIHYIQLHFCISNKIILNNYK
jgi:hypothetical protein